MGQKRWVDQDVFSCPDLLVLPATARLLWLGIIICCKEDGTIRADERYLKHKILACLQHGRCKVDAYCEHFVNIGMLSVVHHEGVKYYKITNFENFHTGSYIAKAKAKDRDRDDSPEQPKGRSGPPSPSPPKPTPEVPEDLRSLELYARDPKLCRSWSSLRTALRDAYPAVPLLETLRQAHAWEVANPKNRKKDRARFLHRWFSRQQDRAPRIQTSAEERDDSMRRRGQKALERYAKPEPGTISPEELSKMAEEAFKL